MEQMKIRITFTEPVLGTLPSEKDIYDKFIASKAPTAEQKSEEVDGFEVPEVDSKGKTVFPRLEDGTPYIYDYQFKGFFKDTIGGLRKVPGTESSKIKAYKKEVDKLIFVEPRRIPIVNYEPIGECQRPLRAQTMQGERVTLACSEEIPAGATMELTIIFFNAAQKDLITECLDYGRFSGLGQWRNSGKGRFVWEDIS